MSSLSRSFQPRFSAAALVLLLSSATPVAFAQAFYSAAKSQVFTQTAAGGSVADPITPFVFGAEASTAATLTLPAGTTVTLAPRTGESGFRVEQGFATKAALDAAFPNGTYRVTGTGIPTLSLNLATEAYPAANPSITNGTWTNGVLVVNPTQATTLNFSTNSSYGTGGVASHMSFTIEGTTDSSVDIGQEIATQPVFGINQSATPFTSFTIPANALANGRVYTSELQFDVLGTLDTTSVPGGGAVSLWQKSLRFFIVAQTPGTGTPAAPSTPVLANQTGVAGGSVTFTVPPVPPNPNVYIEWYFNGQRLNIGPNSTKYSFNNFPGLTINNLTAADAGTYQVRIVTAGGLALSNAAQLTLGAGSAPVFTAQPNTQPVTVTAGSTVVISAAATGVPTPSYQWQRDGVNIAGATSPMLVLLGGTGPNATLPGSYRVVASSGGTSVTSTATPVAIVATSDAGRLLNLSILTPLGAGELMTMGTVLGGGNTSGTKALLARAAGPSLSQFGISAFLPNPTMTLNFTSSTPAVPVATNAGWGGSATLSNAFASVGAFAYTNTTSRDSALFQTALAPGNYTVEVKDAGNGSGTVIAELYDATAGAAFTPTTPRLINVSVLKQINAGTSLTAGFVLGGATARTVLVRAVGPRLGQAPFNIGGAMPAPTVTLVNSTSGARVATNSGWGGDPALLQAGNRVGAFAVTDGSSKDAMLLVTLVPGPNYTAEVAPAAGTAGGTVIVEVYEVP